MTLGSLKDTDKAQITGNYFSGMKTISIRNKGKILLSV